MAEQIIVEYLADIQGFRAQLKSVEDSMKKVESVSKDSAKATEKHFESAGTSIKKGALEIAGALGLAFGVHKVVEFGKESIKAFAEAEVNANKLRFAVEKIGGEGSVAFKKLIEQSEKLQKSTIFSDDAIQQSQTALTQFGLTSDQVEALIPQIADLASATGEDLAGATQKAIQGINGQTRGLKTVGIQYEDTGSKTENLALLTQKLTKFNGASAEAMETVTGKAKRLENAFGDIQEKIGEYLVNEGAAILDNFEVVFGGKGQDVALRKEIEKVIGVMDEVNEKTLAKAKESEQNRLNAIVQTNNNILALYEARGKQENFSQQKNIDAQIKNQQKLNTELRNLNKKRAIEDDATLGGNKAGNKANEDALKLKEDSLKALTDLDIKADQASLTQLAQSESEKIELARSLAIQEVMVAQKAAIDAGNAKIDAELITQNALANIRKNFDGQQADIAKKQNEAEFAEAIAFAESLGDAEAKIEIENQKERLKEYERGIEQRRQLEEDAVKALGELISSIGGVSKNITDQKINDIDRETEAQLTSLKYQLDQKQITQEEYDLKVEALEKTKSEKQAVLKKQQFETDRQIALIKIIMATAEATITQFAKTGFAGAILAGIVGAAQLAIVATQPVPQFEKGGKVKGERHYAGGTLIEAERDEMIVNRNDAMKNDKLLHAINEGKGDKFIFDYYIAPALKAQQKKNLESKDQSFAKNLANSMSLNFKDGNLLDSMKQSRKNDRDNALFIVKNLKSNSKDARRR